MPDDAASRLDALLHDLSLVHDDVKAGFYTMERRFAEMDQRFNKIEGALAEVLRRLPE